MKLESNNEQLILEAAEAEFLEKGYKNTPTTAIAKRAGVTHAMLHYYFRTKENLFRKVFQNKVRLLGNAVGQHVNENLPFEELVRKLIESHFDFIRQNPKIVNFILTEVVNNEENKRILLDELRSKFSVIFERSNKLLINEILKGKVKPIKTIDLLLNVLSMNVMTFNLFPILAEVIPAYHSENFENLLDERKESIVQFVLNALRV